MLLDEAVVAWEEGVDREGKDPDLHLGLLENLAQSQEAVLERTHFLQCLVSYTINFRVSKECFLRSVLPSRKLEPIL
jgi:hypothetical protein